MILLDNISKTERLQRPPPFTDRNFLRGLSLLDRPDGCRCEPFYLLIANSLRFSMLLISFTFSFLTFWSFLLITVFNFLILFKDVSVIPVDDRKTVLTTLRPFITHIAAVLLGISDRINKGIEIEIGSPH